MRIHRFRRVRVWATRGFVLACVLVAFFVMYRPSLSEALQINEANFNRIQEGMTKAELEEIFGCPPGNYGRRSVPVDMRFRHGDSPSEKWEWCTDQVRVVVWVSKPNARIRRVDDPYNERNTETGLGESKVIGKDFFSLSSETLYERFERLVP
jgi:hypothetical protein